MDASLKPLELDGEIQHFNSDMSFGDISNEIKTKLGTARVLTEIIVDNKTVSLSEEETLNTKAFKDLGKVVFKTRKLDELFRESLAMAPKICEALQLDCDDVEGFLSSENVIAAQERVAEMTSLLEWLLQLISGLQSLGNDNLDTMTFSQGKVMDTVRRMETFLAKLHMHLAAAQWPEFKAVLKGDFYNEVSVWKVLFEEVSKTWSPKSTVAN